MALTFASLLLLSATCSGCDPVWQETHVRQSRPRVEGERFDPQESDSRYSEAFAAADRRAERAVGNTPRNERFIFEFWRAKKRILKEDFGIEWRTPAELNPNIEYESYGQPKISRAEQELVRLAVAPLMDPAESLIAVWREFDGKISMTTKNRTDKKVRIYYLVGSPDSWKVSGPFEIIFD